MNGWRFADPESVAALTTRQIIRDRSPILLVSHYAEDGVWEFTGGGALDEADAMVVGLREVFGIDPSIGELADLPLGWQASRTAAGQTWRRQRLE